jgi:hypothetical protein
MNSKLNIIKTIGLGDQKEGSPQQLEMTRGILKTREASFSYYTKRTNISAINVDNRTPLPMSPKKFEPLTLID